MVPIHPDHRPRPYKVLVSIKQDLYDLGAPDTSGFPAIDTDDARLIVAAFGKDGPPVAAKRLTVKGRQFPVTVELTVDDLAFPLTKVGKRRRGRKRRRRWLGGGLGGGAGGVLPAAVVVMGSWWW